MLYILVSFFMFEGEGNKLAPELARRVILSADTDVWVEDLPDDLDTVFRSDFY